VILFVIRQSTRLVTKRIVFHDDGRIEEVEPRDTVPPDSVTVLQPYGALFFATASTLLDQMPRVTAQSRNSVVILRVRGADDAGATMIEVLRTYAESLRAVDSKLVFVTDNERVIRQLRVTGATDVIGARNVYRSNAFLGETTRRAHTDALAWVQAHRVAPGGSPEQADTAPHADADGRADQEGPDRDA
jgi:SulP family sulfate permease